MIAYQRKLRSDRSVRLDIKSVPYVKMDGDGGGENHFRIIRIQQTLICHR